ncbi:MAG: DUF6624 domain-containing protein [Bacteroidota bacterium]
MKRIFFFCCFAFFVSTEAEAQFLKKADSLYNEGQLMLAIDAYKESYKADSSDDNNIYNLACAFAQAGMPDSAFKYLYITSNLNSEERSLSDPDFLPLKKDKRWDVFENYLVALIQQKYDNPIADEDYARKLWRMKALDQAYYRDLELLRKKADTNVSAEKSLWQKKEVLNKQNQKEIELLIAKKGWPKISQVGNSAAAAAFLIIQHSELPLQKKYLPVIKKLCEKREAVWSSYALMYDRIQVSEKKPQRYGSQVNLNPQTNKHEPFPLEDESKVDEWRKEIGMQPLAEYLKHWDIKWEPKVK